MPTQLLLGSRDRVSGPSTPVIKSDVSIFPVGKEKEHPLGWFPAAVGYLVTKLSFVTKDVEIVQGTQKF